MSRSEGHGEADAGGEPRGRPVVESGPARRGPGASGDESPRDAVSRGLRTRPLPIRRGWPAGPSPQLGGARVSERLPRRRTGGGGTRKRGQRSALLRLPAPGGAGLASASPVAARAWGLAARAPWPARRSRGRAPPPRTDCRAVRCARRSRGGARPAESRQDAHQGVPHSAAHELGRVPGGPALHDPGEGGGKPGPPGGPASLRSKGWSAQATPGTRVWAQLNVLPRRPPPPSLLRVLDGPRG